MSRSIYSRPFIRVQGLIGYSDSIEVPIDHVYVVRTLAVYWDTDLTTTRHIFFELESTGQTLFHWQANPVTQESHYDDVRFQFVQTERFRMHVNGTGIGVDVFVGGYDLAA